MVRLSLKIIRSIEVLLTLTFLILVSLNTVTFSYLKAESIIVFTNEM